MHKVLTNYQSDPIILSQNSLEYPEYLTAGYCELFSGTLRECQEYMEELKELML